MAVTLDRLGFGNLVPGASGTPLEGVSIDGLTLMMVPPAEKKFGLNEATLPPRIKAAISDILKASQKPTDVEFQDGINFFGEFDLKASGDMVQLMQFVGMENTALLPVSGVLGPDFFYSMVVQNMSNLHSFVDVYMVSMLERCCWDPDLFSSFSIMLANLINDNN